MPQLMIEVSDHVADIVQDLPPEDHPIHASARKMSVHASRFVTPAGLTPRPSASAVGSRKSHLFGPAKSSTSGSTGASDTPHTRLEVSEEEEMGGVTGARVSYLHAGPPPRSSTWTTGEGSDGHHDVVHRSNTEMSSSHILPPVVIDVTDDLSVTVPGKEEEW